MHIPVGRARCHAQSPSSQEQKQTEWILFHVDVAKWKTKSGLSVFAEWTYYISSRVQLNAQTMGQRNILFLKFE